MALRKSSIIFYLIFNVINIAIFNVIFLPSSINGFNFHPQDYYDNPAIVETHSHVALDSTPSIHSPTHIEQQLMSNKSSRFPTSYLPENKFEGIKSSTGDFQSSNIPKSNLRDTNSPSSYRHHHPRLPIRGVPASSNHGQGQSRPVIDADHESNQKTNIHESNQKTKIHESNQKANHESNQKTNHESNQEKGIKTKKRAPSSPGSKIQMKKKEVEKVQKVHHHHVHEVSSKEEPEEERSNPESDQTGRGRAPANEGRTLNNEGRTSNNEGRSQGGNSKHDHSSHDHSTSGKSKHDHSTGNGNQDQSEAEPEVPQVNVQVLSPEYTSEDYGNQYDTQDPSSGVDPHYHHNLRSYYDYHDPYPYHHAHEPVSYRSEFYWLIPLVMIIGIGALLLPLCSLFMTTLASNGAVGLGGRRRKRRRRAAGLNGNFFKENGQDWTGPLLDLKYTGLDIFTLFDDDGLSEQIDRLLTTLGKSIGME